MPMDLARFLRVFSPPHRAEDDDNRPRQAYFVILTVMVVSILIGIVDMTSGISHTLPLILSGIPSMVFAFWLNNRGKTSAAIYVLLVMMLLVLTVVISFGNGIHDTGIVFYPVVVTLASAMIGRRALLLFVVLVTLSITLVVYGEVYGFLTHISLPTYTQPADIVVLVLILSIAGYANRLLMDAPEQALAQLKVSQEALREGESRYRLLSENVTDLVWTSDLQLRFRFVSSSVEKIFGWTQDEWMANRPEAYLTSASVQIVEQTIQRELARNHQPGVHRDRSVSLELEQRRKDGSFFWTEVSARFLWDGGDEPTGIIGVTRDITDRKRVEEEVKRLNAELERRVVERTSQLESANRELEAFSYSVSHDLRAPIRHILGYLQLLEGGLKDRLTPDGERHWRTVERSAQRMAQLIDDLLKLSRLSRAEMRTIPTDLGKVARMLWARLHPADAGRPVKFIIGQTPLVSVDPGLMEIVLENLLSNALKFTSKTEHPCIEFGFTRAESGPAFFVRDNGAGFDMTYANKLFGVFQRLHDSDEFPGTGIGLATVHRILQRHGGRIWAEGKVDEGATFSFTLPTT